MGRLTFNWPFAWSLIAIGILAIAAVAKLVPVLSDALGPKPSAQAVVEEITNLMSEHDETQMAYRQRFEGRSIFFEPPAPRRETPPPPPPPNDDEEEKNEPPEDIGPPPPPSIYGGPAIVAIAGNSVWFENGNRIAVGEEADGVEVLALNSAWSAQLGWSRGEYDVSIYDVPDGFGRTAMAEPVDTLGGGSNGSTRGSTPTRPPRPVRPPENEKPKGPPE